MWLPTPLGPLWLEVSPLGVRRLEPALYPRGPEAEGALALRVREAVQAYFAGERPDFLDLPLDYTGLSRPGSASTSGSALCPTGGP